MFAMRITARSCNALSTQTRLGSIASSTSMHPCHSGSSMRGRCTNASGPSGGIWDISSSNSARTTSSPGGVLPFDAELTQLSERNTDCLVGPIDREIDGCAQTSHRTLVDSIRRARRKQREMRVGRVGSASEKLAFRALQSQRERERGSLFPSSALAIQHIPPLNQVRQR